MIPRPTIGRILVLLALCAPFAPMAQAQDEVQTTERSSWNNNLRYLVGVKVTSPQRYALSLSTFVPLGESCPALLLQAEPGYGGGKLNIGFGGACAGIITAGGALKLSLLRSWHDPVGIPVNQTYLGVELELMCSFINGSIGAYQRIDGDRGDDWIVSTGIGLGF